MGSYKTTTENEKMRLIAFAKLLNRKINSANKKVKNPYLDYNSSFNPFNLPIHNTFVWVEKDDDSTD